MVQRAEGMWGCRQGVMNAIHHIITQQCINMSSSYVKSAATRCTQFALLGLEGLGSGGQMVACRMVPWFACCSSSSPTLIIESFFPKFSSEPAKRFNYDKLAFSDKNLLCPITGAKGCLSKQHQVWSLPAKMAWSSLRNAAPEATEMPGGLLSWSDCLLSSSWDTYQGRWADIKHSSEALVPSTADIGAAKQVLITWA